MVDLSFIKEAERRVGFVHQKGELPKTLEFLSDKNLKGFIEVGSANGGSFFCWASLLKDGPKISVDWNFGFGLAKQDGSVVTGTEENCPAVKSRNEMWRENFDDVYCVDGDSRSADTVLKVSNILLGRQVGWVFIDAWHEYDAMWEDYRNYSQFVAPGGYIGFHDIYQSESTTKFWNEMKLVTPDTIEFTDGTGTGIVLM